MSDHELFAQPDGPRRRDLMTRIAILAGLVAMSVAVLTARPHDHVLESRWRGRPTAWPLQGDIAYRLGMALAAAPGRLSYRIGVDHEDLLQSGIAAYERLALRPTVPNIHAMFRLAVIYSKRGHPEQGVALFERLIQADIENAGLYLAASSVYDPKPAPREKLREALPFIQQRGDWISRLVLVDLHRRLGNEQQARELEQTALRKDRDFAVCFLAVVAAYVLLGLAGLALVARYAWAKLFRVHNGPHVPAFRVTWSVVEALEVAAVLLFGMVFIGLLADIVRRGWDATEATWVSGLVMLLSYLAFCGLALLVMRRRMRAERFSRLHALGLGRRLSLHAALQGAAGYAIFVAAIAGLAMMTHWMGLDDLPAASQTAGEMLFNARGLPELALFFVLICIAAPLLEEIIFRGFIYAGFRRRFPPVTAVLISALVFGAAHITQAFGGMIAIILVGVLLAALYERTRVLWPSIVAHSLHNTLVFIIIVAVAL